MVARVTKAAGVWARFSKSLARRRFRPNQEKVRSTTQRRGTTTETVHVVAPLDDLLAQHWHLGHGRFNLPRVAAAIGPDQFEPEETPAYLFEDQAGPIAVLNGGGVDDDPHRQPFGIDQCVDLATLHLLAGVVTHRVVFAAPFSADFTDWLSRTAAEGMASRPICSRKAMQLSPDRLPCPLALELAEGVVDRRAGRNGVARQVAPGAAGAQQV